MNECKSPLKVEFCLKVILPPIGFSQEFLNENILKFRTSSNRYTYDKELVKCKVWHSGIYQTYFLIKSNLLKIKIGGNIDSTCELIYSNTIANQKKERMLLDLEAYFIVHNFVRFNQPVNMFIKL